MHAEKSLGTVGATHVRFLFGFPFVLIVLAGVMTATGSPLPRPAWTFWPWVIDGAIGPRSVVTITLSGDHRVSDGHAGALFLAEIGKLLQEPDKL